MKKVIFLDRDGTLIKEPPVDYQVDSLEKLEFMPGVFRNLYKLRHFTDYELVVVSNQDGMGTDSFPEEDFRAPHEKFLEAFRNEGVEFDAVHMDPSLPEENSPNRKPRTGMLTGYMEGGYDLENSFVIGDRITDIELAKNLGARAILLGNKAMKGELEAAGVTGVASLVCEDWDQIYHFIRTRQRRAVVIRTTNETEISVTLSLDGEGHTAISTGLGFFDHMLEQLGRHGGIDLEVEVKGDLHVDEHHTIEDTAIVLGEAFRQALGNKRGIGRYAFVLPMDDSLATVAIDFGGRPWIEWSADFKREKIGDMPTEMFFHFFKSFSDAAKCNLNMEVTGSNEHHMIEGLFKAFARAVGKAVMLDPDSNRLPTTKGKL
ncbi:MAG: bifunctional histidinol-phosphatase/imidazoleglycerol-phosphate dehydratase HisB [Bacteroidales bacterium]|nr:bifunctional histidinol-phosphatase/imidazoleglycerol-phosphate dehydratase HisB [Bacteroidales bacterium]